MFRKSAVLMSAAVLGVFAAAGGVASANVRPADATDACQAMFNGCSGIVVAQSAISSHDFYPHSDAGLTVVGTPKAGANVQMNISNDLQDGSQDFTINYDDFVGDGSDGMTPFDTLHYGGDALVSIEFTPFGQDTGWCLQPSTTKTVLESCDGGTDQAFILTDSAPFVNPATHGYTFVLWAPQAANSDHHLAIDAPGHLSGNVDAQRLVNVSHNHASTFMWNTIP